MVYTRWKDRLLNNTLHRALKYACSIVLLGPFLGGLLGTVSATLVFLSDTSGDDLLSTLALGMLYGAPVGSCLGALCAAILGWPLTTRPLSNVIFFLFGGSILGSSLSMAPVFILGPGKVPFGGFFPVIGSIIGIGLGYSALEYYVGGREKGR